MRDILLTLTLIGLLPVGLKRPFVGALMFAIISLGNPHRLTWGFAYDQPWALAYAGVTMAGLLATRERIVGDSIRRYLPMLIYLAWMGITTIFAFEHEDAVHRWEQVAKVHLMCLVTLCLLTDWPRIKQLVWVVVCCIGFFGLKGGVFTILSGGEYRVWGPPGTAIEDNNHLAVGLVMMLPLMYWLYTDTKKRWLRLLIAFSGLMSVASIFGSHSRSAFLGITAISVFLVLKSKHKIPVAFVTILTAAMVAGFMPQDYWNRMGTIETYQQDASAMGRINVWRTAVNIANHRLTGAGFEYYTPRAFARYAPNPDDVHSSHSIYFQAIGEHGWIGFILFLFICVYIWTCCRQIAKISSASPYSQSQLLLARMIQVSLIGFSVGGAFVNIGNWDMVYYLAIIAMATARCTAYYSAQTKSTRTNSRRPPLYSPAPSPQFSEANKTPKFRARGH